VILFDQFTPISINHEFMQYKEGLCTLFCLTGGPLSRLLRSVKTKFEPRMSSSRYFRAISEDPRELYFCRGE